MRTSLPVLLVTVACGGSSSTPRSTPEGSPSKMDSMMSEGMARPEDEASRFGPLEIGADYASYTRVNTAPFESPTHGGRMVDVYVNQLGLTAYQGDDETEIPVGTIVVKTSQEHTGEAGPIFVMEKREAGFNPDHGDWWYAIHWAEPASDWKGGPIYWRTPSPKADYCADCHDSFLRELGGVPAAQRSW